MIRCNFFPSKTCGHTINEFNRLTGATTALHGFPCCWSSRSHQQTVQIRDSRPSHLAVPFAHAVVRIHSELRNKRTDPAKSILPLAHKHKFVSIRWWRSPPLFFFNVCFNGRPVKQYFFFLICFNCELSFPLIVFQRTQAGDHWCNFLFPSGFIYLVSISFLLLLLPPHISFISKK